jgi:hypothetical protein
MQSAIVPSIAKSIYFHKTSIYSSFLNILFAIACNNLNATPEPDKSLFGYLVFASFGLIKATTSCKLSLGIK